MNQGNEMRAYFADENDAKSAAHELRAQGYNVDVHSEKSMGEKFMDSIKNLFSGERDLDRYRSGAIVTVSGGDRQTVQSIVERYNGRLSGAAEAAASGMSAAAGAGAGMSGMRSETGEVDYSSASERERARVSGSAPGDTGTTSGTIGDRGDTGDTGTISP